MRGCCVGAVISCAGLALPAEPVLAVSGFFWDRLLRPAQQRMHFFQDWVAGIDHHAVMAHNASPPEQPAPGPLQGSQEGGSFSYLQVIQQRSITIKCLVCQLQVDISLLCVSAKLAVRRS